MDEQYLKAIHPVTAVLHWKILSILKNYDIKTLLDVGGTGKLRYLSQYDVSEANLKDGFDGCDLPYEDNAFDAVVSIATLEHVQDQAKFLEECDRVVHSVIVHWFPCGLFAEKVEELKKKYGHWHACVVPDASLLAIDSRYSWETFMNCCEHLLLCMTLTPSLKVIEIYDFIIENYNKPYGLILTGEK